MAILYALLLLFIIVLIWRINHPGDLRLNRAFIGRYVKDLKGRGPQRIQISRLPVNQPADQPEERVFYNVDAEFADGSKKSVLAQIIYPLEALQSQRKSHPGVDDMMESMSSGSAMQRGDYAERLKEDPFKDMVQEEKLLVAKTVQVNSEVGGLKRLNSIGVLFPRFIAHDEKRWITLTEGVGTRRLDDQLQQLDQAGRRELLQAVVGDLAIFHNSSKGLIGCFPPGAGHTEKKIRDALQDSLANWELCGAPVSTTDFLEILDAARPLLETTQVETGLRLVDSSPRAFFLQGEKAERISWDGVREDVSAFDIIELVCDPAVGLSANDELQLFRYYLERRDLADDEKAELGRDLLRLAIYFRLVLLGYLARYRSAKLGRQGGIKHWGTDALSVVVRNLRAEMAEDPELADLRIRLEPCFSVMEGLR